MIDLIINWKDKYTAQIQTGVFMKFQALEKCIKEEYINVAGILILKENRPIYEQYFNGYTKDDALHLASVTKSVLSILIGIAIDKGNIESVHDKVLKYFPQYKVKRGEKTIQNISIKHLLTMTAPYKYKSEPYAKVFRSEDWTKSALDLLGGKGTIGTFKYTTVGTQILSGILVSATGQSVLDFASDYLFTPLGIKVPGHREIPDKESYFNFVKGSNVSGWVVDPMGVNTSGWGLALTVQDMSKLGQLYLNRGLWHGKHIVSDEWIAASTREHSRLNHLSYGYLWWLIKVGKKGAYAAIGDGGNIIYICPEKDLVVAIASSFMPRAKDQIELIEKEILPLI